VRGGVSSNGWGVAMNSKVTETYVFREPGPLRVHPNQQSAGATGALERSHECALERRSASGSGSLPLATFLDKRAFDDRAHVLAHRHSRTALAQGATKHPTGWC